MSALLKVICAGYPEYVTENSQANWNLSTEGKEAVKLTVFNEDFIKPRRLRFIYLTDT
jgi:hypothetical protein